MLNGWLTSKKRKVHQRAMNKLVRDMNKSIKNDHLWNGRFYAQQIWSEFYEYEDKSGAELNVQLRLIDRKTGITYDSQCDSANSWRFCNGWRLFELMNWFITEYVKVWERD